LPPLLRQQAEVAVCASGASSLAQYHRASVSSRHPSPHAVLSKCVNGDRRAPLRETAICRWAFSRQNPACASIMRRRPTAVPARHGTALHVSPAGSCPVTVSIALVQASHGAPPAAPEPVDGEDI
jgi:hypothetical protein